MNHNYKGLRPLFSFYGSKWRTVPKYDPPKYDKIFEPFAGSACYSLRFYKCEVHLNDLDPVLYGLWKYLKDATKKDILDLPLLEEIKDQDVTTMGLEKGASSLIGFWFGKGLSRPSTKMVGWGKHGAFANQYWGKERRQRVAEAVPLIKHWVITKNSYDDMPHQESAGTWFIDPPYQAVCGRSYTKGSEGINFKRLGKWCRERQGQVIVCENHWLPFKPLGTFKTVTKEEPTHEMVWTQG